ncbi:MAG: 4Fe-4S dicluster domain-containing protein, partial [Gammaproteobacteria bacterium]|nr:4Fe-4S dicluster domain-containing protein [Gammaproteobacteria bacterium]
MAVIKDMARYEFDMRICLHCDDPECLVACPPGAISIDGRGVAIIDDDLCIQCGACAEACPYDAIFYHESQGRYLKCDLCAGRAEGPLCVQLCPVGALTMVSEGGTG